MRWSFQYFNSNFCNTINQPIRRAVCNSFKCTISTTRHWSDVAAPRLVVILTQKQRSASIGSCSSDASVFVSFDRCSQNIFYLLCATYYYGNTIMAFVELYLSVSIALTTCPYYSISNNVG